MAASVNRREVGVDDHDQAFNVRSVMQVQQHGAQLPENRIHSAMTEAQASGDIRVPPKNLVQKDRPNSV